METQENQPSSEGASQDAGLLDSATVATPEDQGQQEPQAIEHRAQDANQDDEPLERPDFWPENFWNKDNNEPDLEGIAKSWMDLRKQISQGKHKAPADGKYDTTAFGGIPENDPVRQHVLDWAKEFNVSQSAFDSLIGKVVEMGVQNVEQSTRTVKQERAALGPNAESIIKGMVDWASGLVNKGIWGKDDFEEFKVMGGTANGIKALMKLRESYEGTRIPTSSMPVEGAPSKEELYQMVADPRYKTDNAYRTKVEKLFLNTFQ